MAEEPTLLNRYTEGPRIVGGGGVDDRTDIHSSECRPSSGDRGSKSLEVPSKFEKGPSGSGKEGGPTQMGRWCPREWAPNTHLSSKNNERRGQVWCE